MSERPFRHLCPEADARDAMTDDEFWEHVGQNLSPSAFDPPMWDDDGPDLDVTLATVPCNVCGATGACGHDAEGRPMIHTEPEDDEP